VNDRIDRYLVSALRAARAAQREMRQAPLSAEVKAGDMTNVVTDRDFAAQDAIFRILRDRHPGVPLIGEEGGEGDWASNGSAWIVDPIDGTSNFARSRPPFGSSIAFGRAGQADVGVILAPWCRGIAWAVRGRGAFLRIGGRAERLAVSDIGRPAESTALTGYGYARESHPGWLARVARSMPALRALRVYGSAVHDLIAVARGLADIYWEDELQPWDWAAGALLVEEAGGRVTDLSGDRLVGRPGGFLATNGRLHDAAVALLRLSAEALW